MTYKRPYVANRFCLELQHQVAGWLLTADGGLATTEAVEEHLAGGHPVRKHAGNVKVDEITIQCGTSMSQPFYKWLTTSLNYEHERKEGAIITADYDFKEVARLDFHEALLTEIGLPGVDALSKDACKFTLKLSPEYTQTKYSNGTQSILPTPAGSSMQQKRWMAANFKLMIDGMNCKPVNKVEAITIKQTVIDNAIGERLIFQKEPAAIQFPNVIFTIPEIFADPWYQWYDEFVCRGNSTPDKEKAGHLEYLASDCTTVLFILQFQNLGIVKFTPDKLDSSSDRIRYVKIEMYCEKMDFEYKSPGTAM